jgi:hypothetical protein
MPSGFTYHVRLCRAGQGSKGWENENLAAVPSRMAYDEGVSSIGATDFPLIPTTSGSVRIHAIACFILLQNIRQATFLIEDLCPLR